MDYSHHPYLYYEQVLLFMLRLALPLRALQVLAAATGSNPASLLQCHRAMAQAVVFPPMSWLRPKAASSNSPVFQRNNGDFASSTMGTNSTSSLESCENTHSTRRTKTRQKNVHLHLIVLVHGWMGNPLELRYLQDALE
jgi:hypothetical protein